MMKSYPNMNTFKIGTTFHSWSVVGLNTLRLLGVILYSMT